MAGADARERGDVRIGLGVSDRRIGPRADPLACFSEWPRFWICGSSAFVMRDVPVSDVMSRLLPWTTAGFVLMVISGVADVP